MLDNFRSQDKSIASEEEEKSIEKCVSKGIMKTNQQLKLVSAKDFRRTVFPDKRFEDSPCSSKLFLYFLSASNTQNRLTELNVRYVIIVSVTTSESEAYTHSDPEEFGQHVCFFGQKWNKDYDMNAEILDVKYLRESGSVKARSTGTRQYGVVGVPAPCLILLPIPVYYTEQVEVGVCLALGEAVMKFIINGHDVVPTTELGTGIDSGGRGSDIQSDIQTAPQPESEEDLLKRTQEPKGNAKDSQN